MNIIDQLDCLQSYGTGLTSSMMCAGYMQGGRDTCLVRYHVQSGAIKLFSHSEFRKTALRQHLNTTRKDYPSALGNGAMVCR